MRDAAEEIGGAVDRVDDPQRRALLAEPALLAEHGIVAEGGAEALHDQVLGLLVGLRDEILPALVLDRQRAATAIVVERQGAGFARDLEPGAVARLKVHVVHDVTSMEMQIRQVAGR